MTRGDSGGYTPLYVGGRRDVRKRYVSPEGNIISYRQYIKLSQGVTPEQKAYQRYVQGKAPRGKTATKIEKRIRKKKEKQIEREAEKRIYDYKDKEPLKEKDMVIDFKRRGIKIKRHQTYQLEGEYEFYSPKLDEYATSIGFSTHTSRMRKDKEFIILRAQAVRHAKAQLPGSGWEMTRVIWEQWLKW